jgi:hypothetical protein
MHMYRQYDKNTTEHSQSFVKEHQWGITLGVAVVGVILIVGFLFSGGTTPNNRGIGSIFEPIPAYKSGLGSINGYVAGPLGLPAVGSTVIAAEQGGTGVTETQFVSIDGKYVFSDLPPGDYIIMAAFPDGSSTSLDNVRIQSGSVQTLNIKY